MAPPNPGCVVTRKYEVEEGVSGFLDELEADTLFDYIEGNPDDVMDKPNETKDYRITIKFRKNPDKIIEGSFDKNGLPDDWAEFAEYMWEFMRFYGIGEIVNPFVYSKARRRKGDFIYCSVEFGEGGKSYYYRTEDDSIDVGDKVIVTVGKDIVEKTVTVKEIDYYQEESVPLPLDKTKMILRKSEEQ